MENTDGLPPIQTEIKKEPLYVSEVDKPVEVSSGKTVPFIDWLKRLGFNLKEKGVATDATIFEDKNANGELEYFLTIVPGQEYGNLGVEASAQKQTQQDFLKEGEVATPYYLRKPNVVVPLETAKPIWKLSKPTETTPSANKA